MAHVDQIIRRIREAHEEISLLEMHLQQEPEDFQIQISLDSIRAFEEQLREELERVAVLDRVPICRYRMFREEDGAYPVTALSDSIGRFQRLFSVVYDALHNGKKIRSTISADVEKATSLDFGYAFAGSLGIVMTMPRAQALFGENELDITMKTVMEMASSTSSDHVHAFAELLGPAPIRSLYSWAESHSHHDIGADIQWKDHSELERSLFVEVSALSELMQVILEVSDESSTTETFVGELIGANIKRHWFHLETDDGQQLSGQMADTIGDQYTVELPKRYKASITKKTKLNYATDEAISKYFLNALEPVD